MSEFKLPEINETKKPESVGFEKIQPDKNTNLEEAKGFWKNYFEKVDSVIENIKDAIEGKEFGGQYNSEEHMLDHTPSEDSKKGHWDGERGKSKFIPNENTEAGLKAKEKLAEYGLDGINYKNGEPDFSKCSEATVVIDKMTANRDNYLGEDGNVKYGNFAQADIKCAEKWCKENKDGKNDWTGGDVCRWRHENNCTWHEQCDTKSMDLVSKDIHNSKDPVFLHSGGVSECKVRDGVNVGGEFDE